MHDNTIEREPRQPMNESPFTLEFYEENGSQPVREWLEALEKMEPAKFDAILYGLQEILAKQGIGVCNSDFGKNLKGGLYEFKLRQDHAQLVSRVQPRLRGTVEDGPEVDVLLRVFFAAYGNKIILLLGGRNASRQDAREICGYDKGQDSSSKRQRKEIAIARKRLARHPLNKSKNPLSKERILRWVRDRSD